MTHPTPAQLKTLRRLAIAPGLVSPPSQRRVLETSGWVTFRGSLPFGHITDAGRKVLAEQTGDDVMPRLEQPEREWLTPEEADTIVSNLITTMIREGYGPEIIALVRDHLRATLQPLVRVQQTGETT